MNLFRQLEGKSGEPFTTKLLGYLLRFDQIRSALLSLTEDFDSRNPILDVDTEKAVNDERPDIALIGKDRAIIIELKFEAALTDAQRAGYTKWFQSNHQGKKQLLFIVPDVRKSDLSAELDPAFKKQQDISYDIISWETLLSKLDELRYSQTMLILEEFTTYIRWRLKMDAPLSPEDMKLLVDKTFASRYRKLLRLFDRFREQVSNDSSFIDKWESCSSQPEGYMGLNVNLQEFKDKGIQPWVGLWLDPWQDLGESPFWLSFECTERQASKLRQQLGTTYYYEDEHLISPLKFTVGNSLTAQAQSLVTAMKDLLKRARLGIQ